MTETQAAPEDQKTYWGAKHQNKKVRAALRATNVSVQIIGRGNENQ